MIARLRPSELLHPDLVLPEVSPDRKEDLIVELASRMARHHRGLDGDALAIALLKRERLMSTALSDGIAVPHARLRTLPRMVAALARSSRGIEWGAQDGGLTHVVFVLVVRDDEPGSHLRVLAAATRVLHDTTSNGELMRAPDATALLAAMRAAEARTLAPAATAAPSSVA